MLPFCTKIPAPIRLRLHTLLSSRKGNDAMGLRIQTALARRRMQRRRKYKSWRWLPALLLLVLLLPAMTVLSLRPKLIAYAENYVQYQATVCMEQAVAQCAAEMGGIGRTQTDETGAVRSLVTDTAAVNTIRTRIVRQVYDDIGAMETAHTSVPIGTLIDPQYLAGFGPEIPFGVTALGQVTAVVDSDFTSSGINQTIYELTICVTANFSIRTLGRAENVTISAEYPLEETIIVGDVPLIAADSQ